MKKKVLAVLMSAVMVGSLMAAPVFAAENLSDTTEGVAQFEGLTANEAYDFQIVVKSFQSTYWQAALQGMDAAAEELGVTYTAQGPASESDIADQVNMLNSAINGAPAGVGLAACDTSSVLESLQTAVDAGVPIVAFDTGIADAPEGSVVETPAGRGVVTEANYLRETVKVSFETGADTYEIQQFEASEVKNVGRRKKGPGASATISPEEEAELKKITD